MEIKNLILSKSKKKRLSSTTELYIYNIIMTYNTIMHACVITILWLHHRPEQGSAILLLRERSSNARWPIRFGGTCLHPPSGSGHTARARVRHPHGGVRHKGAIRWQVSACTCVRMCACVLLFSTPPSGPVRQSVIQVYLHKVLLYCRRRLFYYHNAPTRFSWRPSYSAVYYTCAHEYNNNNWTVVTLMFTATYI